jgi:hypothetical protein
VCGCEVKAIDGLFTVPLRIYLGDKKYRVKRPCLRVLGYQYEVKKPHVFYFLYFFLFIKLNTKKPCLRVLGYQKRGIFL